MFYSDYVCQLKSTIYTTVRQKAAKTHKLGSHISHF